MRLARPLAVVALALGVLGIAIAARHPVARVATIVLPGGTIREVRLSGDAPPPAMLAAERPDGMADGLDRVAAMVDVQADAMVRPVDAAPPTPAGGVTAATVGSAPAGARYRFTQTTVVDGRSCTTSVESVSRGGNRPPATIRAVSGDGCAAATGARPPVAIAVPVPPVPPAPPRAPTPDTI